MTDARDDALASIAAVRNPTMDDAQRMIQVAKQALATPVWDERIAAEMDAQSPTTARLQRRYGR